MVARPITSRLANGTHVVTRQMPGIRSAAAGIWLLNGVRHELPGQSGYAHLLEHMLFQGTYCLEGSELVRRFEAMGGLYNAYTGRELTAFHGLVPGAEVTELLALFTAMLTRARFDPAALARERQVILREMRAVAGDIEEAIVEEGIGSSWPDSPMGNPLLGNAQSLQAATAAALRDYHVGLLQGARIWVVAAGNVRHQDIERAATPLADLATGRRPAVGPPSFRAVTVTRPRPVNQAHLLWLMPIPGAASGGQCTVPVANQLLAGSTASCLYRALRNRWGLVYRVFSRAEQYTDCGLWQLQASCLPEDIDDCRQTVQEALARLIVEGPSESDLTLAKRHLRARLLIDEDCPEVCIERLVRESISLQRHPTVGERLGRLEEVTGDAVRAALSAAWRAHTKLCWVPENVILKPIRQD